MSNMRLGLVGAGVIGQRHLLAIQKIPSVSIVGIADPSPLAVAVAAKFAVPLFEDTESLIDGEALDGLIVATPTESHYRSTITALNAGLAVLIEKPITATLAEAEEVIATSRNRGTQVLVGHHRRYYRFTEQAKEIIQSGAIGSLVCVSGQWNMRKHASYYEPDWRKRWKAGPVLTNLIHDFDLLRYLCGDIESVSAETSNVIQGFEKEDAAAIAMRFKAGSLGAFVLSDQSSSPWSWESGTGENRAVPASGENAFRFMGTEGSLEFPNLKVWRHQSLPYDWENMIEGEAVESKMTDAFVEQILHFSRVIQGLENPRTSAEDATMTLRSVLAVLKSARTGKRVHI